MCQVLGASWHLVRVGFWQQVVGMYSLLCSVKSGTAISFQADTCLLSAQAAEIWYRGRGGLNNRHLFLTLLEAGSLRSGCHWGQLPVTASFLLCPHLGAAGAGVRSVSVTLLKRTLVL